MRKLLIAISLAGAWAGIGSSEAQVYPSRPITMVVPLPPGSAFDVTARILAEPMRASLGQPIVVENVTGAAGSIGTGQVARAAPDGYTLVFGGANTHVVNAAVLPLRYDVVKDFAPVALTATMPLLIVGKKAMQANSLNELITWLRANPDKATLGTGGQGNVSHIAAIVFQKETGTRLGLVPYRGAGAAINDLVAGHIDMMVDLVANSLPHVRARSIKAYAVAAKSRLAAASDIPTVEEAGLPGFHISAWQAIWAPKGTPNTVIDKVNAAVVVALAEPSVRARLADLGQQIFPRDQQTPEALAAFQAAEIDRWWPIIKAANIKAE
jgi:tripartite-type tricarboxylate transporter receptor subunit TctC